MNTSRPPARPLTPPKSRAPRRSRAPRPPVAVPSPAPVSPAPARNGIVVAWRDIEVRAVGTTAFFALVLLVVLALGLGCRAFILLARSR